MSDYLRHQTLALLGQEFLAQALASGGSLNAAVADLLLQPRAATTGKEKTAAAMTGQIRSDAAMLRQGAKNAGEAASMAEIVKNAALSIGQTLSAMQTIVQAVKNGEMTADAATPLYQNHAATLTATIEGARYNGISLLDGSAWDGDERLTRTSGKTADLSIQVGKSASTFSLRDVSNMKNFRLADLGDSSALDRYIGNIETNLATANSLASGYESLAGSYTAQAGYLERQGETLTRAALAAQPGWSSLPKDEEGELPLKSILMDLLLRDQGSIVDISS